MSEVARKVNFGPEFDFGNIQADRIRLKLGDGLVIATDGTISAAIMTQPGYTIFPIWAEEGGGLISNNRQWSFGNGAVGNLNIPVPDCEVFAMSFHADVPGTSVSIELMQNDAAATSELFVGESGYNVLATPIPFAEGDLLGFRTDVETGAYTDCRAVAWCRIPLVGVEGAQGPQGIEGPQGIQGDPAIGQIAKIDVTTGTNVNGTGVDVSYTGATFDNIGVTVSGNQVTLPAGSYMTTLVISVSSAVQRSNQSLSLFIGGVLESTESGEGYIRSIGGHNEAKLTHTDGFVTGGGVINYQSSQIAAGGTVTITTGKLLIQKVA